MATFKPVVRTPRKDGFYKVYIRVVHKIKPSYISTDKLVTKQHVDKDGNITYRPDFEECLGKLRVLL